ncbi:MAG TPA: Ada metal-binding domain-containing protein [Cyclobacteriaceae bacterium]|nr:Ada metal-binding domain-containing protein [Cyclobacteriaceae bacterium]
MIAHDQLTDRELRSMIRAQTITLAGNRSLRIFGTLRCRSGKRMKRINRIFFKNETEALCEGFRPCSNCMRTNYLKWKSR